jgi:hypothetical protein
MKTRISLFLVVLFLLSCASSAWATLPGGSRGVYYGGKLHYISLSDDQRVSHYEGTVSSTNWHGPNGDGERTGYLNLASGYKRQNPNKYAQGEGVVVMGALMLHYAVIWDPTGNPTLVVSRYDFNQEKFLANADGTEAPQVITKLAMSSSGIYGVAATVHRNKIYVFTNQFTLVSEDPQGLAYTLLPPLADGLTDYNALDAITFYPEEGPAKVMVAFTEPVPDHGSGGFAYVVWDGSAKFPLPPFQVREITSEYIGGAALVLGTQGGNDYFSAGHKVPTIQMILQSPYHYKIYLFEYSIPTDTTSYQGYNHVNYELQRLRVYPWFRSDLVDGRNRPVLQQSVVINFRHCTDAMCITHAWKNFALTSDHLVPQNFDSYGLYDWQGIANTTVAGNTPEEEAIRRKYWSLAGVVLGPPPFGTNQREEFEIQEHSNIEYGRDLTNQVKHSSSWSSTVTTSSTTEIKMGLSDKIGVKATLDASYAHGWKGSQATGTTSKAGIDLTMGTTDQTTGNWGAHGWAVFISPTLTVQRHAIYAYDYDIDKSDGTYLGLDLPTISQAIPANEYSPIPITVNAYRFFLANPGGPDDDIPGLMSGIGPFPNSIDLAGWQGQNWEAAEVPWSIIYGTGSYGGAPVPRVKQGTESTVNFSLTAKTEESYGRTNNISIKAGSNFSAATKLIGFEQTLSVGYDSEWSMETATETEISAALAIHYHFPAMSSECEGPSCVKSLVVQPYLLKAKDATAPWVPTNYSLDQPWCIAWQVYSYAYKEAEVVGLAPLPASASGTFVGGAAAVRGSSYAIDGAHMAWLEEDGLVQPIPLTADMFDPAQETSILLNGRRFTTAAALGKWSRHGQVWKYQTKGDLKENAFSLQLDFGNATWSFQGAKLNLTDHLHAGRGHIRVELHVQGTYHFYCDLEHDLEIDWALDLLPADSTRLEVTKYSGSWGRGEDKIQLHGTLPSELSSFGDLTFFLNGHPILFHLLAHEDFLTAMEQKKSFRHKDEEKQIVVDFKKKTWSVEFRRAAIAQLMAPRWGGARLGVAVGGAEWYAREHRIQRFTAKLTFGNTTGREKGPGSRQHQ